MKSITSGSVVVPQPINVSKMGSMQSAAAAHGLGHPLHPQVTEHRFRDACTSELLVP